MSLEVVFVATFTKSIIASLILLGCASHAYAEDTSSDKSYDISSLNANEAYQEGKLLRAQLKNTKARPYLKYSADKGDAKAAYLYAMELSNYNTTIRTPPKAQEYLLKAAQGGNRQAMRHLYLDGNWLRLRERNYWKKHYYNSLITLGQTEPGQAMFELANFYRKSDQELSSYYLNKSLDFDIPKALMEKAKSIESGEGTYIFPGSREKTIDKMYKAAADTGYMPAVRNYIQRLEDLGNYQEAFKWRQKAVKEGDLTSLAAVAIILSGFSTDYQFVDQDLATAKAYYDIYLETAGTDRLGVLYDNIEQHYSDIMKTISPEDLSKSKKIEANLRKEKPFYNHDVYWDI